MKQSFSNERAIGARGRGGGDQGGPGPPTFGRLIFFVINDTKKNTEEMSSFKNWDSLSVAQKVFQHNKLHIA